MQTISANILKTLYQGKNRIEKKALNQLTAFVQSQLLKDQSFKSKSGKSDLYYTLFGWMLSLVLEIPLNAKKMADYLSDLQEDKLDFIHYSAYKRCQLIHYLFTKGRVLTWFKSFYKQPIKSIDEFEHVPHDDPYTPYAQFIRLSLLEDTGNRITNKAYIKDALKPYHHHKGGYMNVKNGITATTNATAAALSLLKQINSSPYKSDIEFLKTQQDISGGFMSVESSPVPDLLSTATALFALKNYHEKPTYKAVDFIEAHWSASGGFTATIMDNKSDVEYCFYGLLALGSAPLNN